MVNSDIGADISWPDLTPPPINLWSLPNFEQAAHRHPSLIKRRRQLMHHLELMQRLLTAGELSPTAEGADSTEEGGSDDHQD